MENQDVTQTIKRHGGARNGAGRISLEKKILRDTNYLAARGATPLMAHEILAHVVDEGKTWKRVLSSADDRVVLSALMFLTSMRDGKPAQSVNITQQSISISAKDVASAREIAREIREAMNPSLGNTHSAIVPALGSGETSPLLVDDANVKVIAQSQSPSEGEEKAKEKFPETMLSGGEGGS